MGCFISCNIVARMIVISIAFFECSSLYTYHFEMCVCVCLWVQVFFFHLIRLLIWVSSFFGICFVLVSVFLSIKFSIMFGRLTLGRVIVALSYFRQLRMKTAALKHQLEFELRLVPYAWRNYSWHVHHGTYTMRYVLLDPKPVRKKLVLKTKKLYLSIFNSTWMHNCTMNKLIRKNRLPIYLKISIKFDQNFRIKLTEEFG